ncbi:MAG: hypothetical protein IT183_14330 [Acidobacteria bacterium]|nr:hypothetical protein [Acidobacteriota bacterium]
MNDSTRRTIRTAYQTTVALLTAVPVLLVIVLGALPEGSDLAVQVGAIFASIVAGVAAVTKILTVLEDRGIIPAWLKADPTGDHEVL